MNHGVVGFQRIQARHSAIWDWVTTSGHELVVYSDASAVNANGPLTSASWQRSRERIVDEDRLLTDLEDGLRSEAEIYARYQPENEWRFILMCDDAMCAPRMSIVVPPEIEDVEATSIIKQLSELFVSINRSALEGGTISQFVSTISFSVWWVYVLGMTRQESFVVFLSQDREVSEGFIACARSYVDNLEIQDCW
ncbi:MAG: hypothetical protein JWN70_4044 [Planctomycetaceae bacterium]|nr:hypothetical protein [Planctomycetaceae bacterium]